ncbi:MAG: signal peptidase I [Ardenticatenales bacterium]|nr:signal peptidase I [Ardenticatenales bacterium]
MEEHPSTPDSDKPEDDYSSPWSQGEWFHQPHWQPERSNGHGAAAEAPSTVYLRETEENDVPEPVDEPEGYASEEAADAFSEAPWIESPIDESESTPERGVHWKSLLHELAETIILTVLIFVMMRAVVQNYRIEGYSMEPNLHEGQRLFVSKLAYYFGEPQRGDIIVFEYPKGDPNGPEKDYIKRIIGLPGDTVECNPGEIRVNGQLIDESYGPNLHSYHCSPTTLGPYEYYVLGDNRNQSSDSHSWGPLERKYIIGKAWLLYWPLPQIGWVPNYPIQAPDPQPVAKTP